VDVCPGGFVVLPFSPCDPQPMCGFDRTL
jgi:hypothetical protein